MDAGKLRDNVERWLTHENYKFSYVKNAENHFTFVLHNVGSFGYRLEVFHPKQQNTALVAGCIVPLKDRQNARYLKLNESQKASFEKRINEYCKSIMAICKTTHEDGRLLIGTYSVLDDTDSFNQHDFGSMLTRVTEMGEEISGFLLKTL